MKAILVIEEPNECIDCPCYRQTKEDGELFEDCKAMMKPLNWREVTEKPSWCPLRSIPNKAAEDLIKGLDAIEKMQSVEVRTIRRSE